MDSKESLNVNKKDKSLELIASAPMRMQKRKS